MPARPWLREPTLHFVLVGVALFTLHALVAPAPSQRSDARTIEVGPDVLAALRLEHEQRTGRPATEAELGSALQRWVDEEVLYREALALGLDRGDPVVRRRLVQKMAFVSEDLVAVGPPSEADLATWLEAHRDRYRRPERFTLEHVFVRRDGRDAEARALGLLETLEGAALPGAIGDPFVRGSRFVGRSRPDLDGVFGPGFGDAVAALPVGLWSGPVASGYGLHLVQVEARVEVEDPALSEVLDDVRRDWLAARRDEANAEALQRLRDGYQVHLVGGAAVQGAPSAEVER